MRGALRTERRTGPCCVHSRKSLGASRVKRNGCATKAGLLLAASDEGGGGREGWLCCFFFLLPLRGGGEKKKGGEITPPLQTDKKSKKRCRASRPRPTSSG